MLILFTSTFIQGHDNFDANTTDDILSSSSSELESGRRCGSHKSKKDVDRDEAEHEKILERILSSSSSSSSNLRSNVFSDILKKSVIFRHAPPSNR